MKSNVRAGWLGRAAGELGDVAVEGLGDVWRGLQPSTHDLIAALTRAQV